MRLQPEAKSITVASNGREAMIEHLEEDSEYSVTVTASTVVGEGPASQTMNLTTFSACKCLVTTRCYGMSVSSETSKFLIMKVHKTC